MSKTRDEVRAEALGALRVHKRAGAGISMGVGKTRLGLEHFQLVTDKVKTDQSRMAKALIVAPTKKIMKGWEEEAEKWGMEHLLEGVTFTTYRSLPKQDYEHDVIYLDECHSLIRDSHDSWLSNYTGYIIGLTGTPPKRDDTQKGWMVKTYCPIVYTYVVDDAVNDNILNDYKITIHMLELSSEESYKVEIKNKDGLVTKSWYTSELKNYNYWTDRCMSSNSMGERQKMSILRMKSMQTYPTKDEYAKRLLDQSKEKCILFANEQKQADKLCAHSYHSNNKDAEPNMEKFESGEITKLSCVLQLSEGANIKGLKESIIMHAYGNNRKAAQRIGRTLRLNPDDIANIHILCFKDTQDEKWVTDALAGFNQDKITWYDPDIF